MLTLTRKAGQKLIMVDNICIEIVPEGLLESIISSLSKDMDIEQENKRLQGTVKLLLRRIEQNHSIQQHFHVYEFKLLSCQCLRDLLNLLLIEA